MALITILLSCLPALAQEGKVVTEPVASPEEEMVTQEAASLQEAEAAPGETEAASYDYEARLDRGLRNAEFYSYHLIERAHAEPERVMELLKEAVRFSPDLPAAYFHLAWVTLTTDPSSLFQVMQYVMDGFHAYRRNFWWSFNLTGVITIGGLLAFLLVIAIVVIVRLGVDMPLMHHEVKEDSRLFVLFLLVFFISTLGPLYFLAGVLMILAFYFKKSDAMVAYIFWGALALLPLLLKPVDVFLSAEMSPSLKAIVEVNEGKDNTYAINVLKDAREREELFSLALALKREGRVEEAINIYRRILDTTPRDARTLNNLGNCYAVLHDNEQAIAMYSRAVEMEPLASTYYNLSQISRELLNFEQGDRFFDKAKHVDADAVTRFREQSSRHPNRYYIDETLGKGDFWSFALRHSRGNMFTGTFVPLTFTPVIGVMIMIAFVAMSRFRKNSAYRCKRCGAIICSKCERSLKWGGMCQDCFTSLVTLEKDPRDRIAKLMAIYDNKRRRKIIIHLLSLVMPGAHLIYAGKILKGAVTAFFFIAPLVLLLAGIFYRISIYPFMHSWLVVVTITVSLVVYIFNILATRRFLRQWV